MKSFQLTLLAFVVGIAIGLAAPADDEKYEFDADSDQPPAEQHVNRFGKTSEYWRALFIRISIVMLNFARFGAIE